MTVDYTVVVPTTGRESLNAVLGVVVHGAGPAPREVIVVDDRPDPAGELVVPADVRVLRTYGRGPAAARNAGWQAASTEWVAFLDDDVLPPDDWPAALSKDLADVPSDVVASQARVTVPLPSDREPTDWERNTAGLMTGNWITADMAYRRAALLQIGGFDERFPRAYREDVELALRVVDEGHRIVAGRRETTHPVRPAGFFVSVRAQRGNADDALMRSLRGRGWRKEVGGRPTRMHWHVLSTTAAAAAILLGLTGRRVAAAVAGSAWVALTAHFAGQRIAPGPRTPDEIARMLVTSVAIPPVACWHRLRGELRVRL
ncbi:glycosyltransferase family 2 protein [Kibdelosporangium phytohabitans]|uniref:Transferase n=1 Tax=Kibdelosporangium phytohabitans TaxID=860235 RepID=A0A0N7F457_9PSEU|nr:glycosyltransferase [Kibdelosporangium phytohabitans]ALG10503.1 transferase [Kibdelosporangium phytohabitans]MBE1461594.1 glycosyltransferase involved in cell wall biosynthesis [Kibdelosporangium phytohabitans]